MSKLSVTAVDKSIGRRIKLRRKELGLTAAALSEQVELSQQQLSRYERGTNKVNVSHLVNIAACLETPISWFFLECEPDVAIQLEDHPERYIRIFDEELKERLDQHWAMLGPERRHTLIAFLDAFSSGNK